MAMCLTEPCCRTFPLCCSGLAAELLGMQEGGVALHEYLWQDARVSMKRFLVKGRRVCVCRDRCYCMGWRIKLT